MAEAGGESRDMTDGIAETPHDTMGTALHVVTRYLRGGSERRVRDMVNALGELEHHVVIGADSDLDLARSQLGTANLTAEPNLRRSPHPYFDLVALTRIRRLISELEPDIVFTHQSKAGAVGRVAARWANKPSVIHSLSMASFGEGYSRAHSSVFRLIERRLAPLTSAYAVVGHDLADRYRGAGVPTDKLRVIRSGVPIPVVEESSETAKRRLSAELGLPADRPWMIHVGSLEQRKNVLMLPRVLDLLGAELGEPPHLIMAGEGPLEDQLRDDLLARGLSGHFTMLGYVDPVAPLIKASEVLILLSSAEGLPQVLVQAASVGTPFVSFDVDGTREMLMLGAQGIVIELGDVASTVPAVIAMLGEGRGTSRVDFQSWAPETIRHEYRNLVTELLVEDEMMRLDVGT